MRIFLFFLLNIISTNLFSWNFINTPYDYKNFVTDTGDYNPSIIYANNLEKIHNIKTFIFFDKKNSDILDGFYKTLKYFKEKENKFILIYVNKNKNKGKIYLSDNIKILSDKHINILEKEVLNALLNKWYMSELKVLNKILGTIYYYISKDEKIQKKIINDTNFININDKLFKISLIPPFKDILNLFYFEPITFIFYFPFITFFIIVRIIGSFFDSKKIFTLLFYLWGLFNIFIFLLIFDRIKIIYPEYVEMFFMFIGLNIPLYFFIYLFYKDKIINAFYNYFYDITGGFYSPNSFEGKKW